MKHTIFSIVASALFATSALATEVATKSIEQLYAEAVAEGGELVIRAGGDKDDQADYYLNMFKERFPEIKLTHSVDLSFYHASRYDNARKDVDNENVPDIIQLQTLHDFDYYAERGLLERYKPKNWEKVIRITKTRMATGQACSAWPSPMSTTTASLQMRTPRAMRWIILTRH
ncbi:hypothetical protein [Roseovarius sp. EL26]|uniref:hypothetical protein n=1 Tax=Roseovarius sp. EL26 TaxID=2126672 RepID=UPI0020B15B0A|nr:hypothetical protein [Roseovarius sp. EL26]